MIKTAKYLIGKDTGIRYKLSDEGLKKANKIKSILKNWQTSNIREALQEINPLGDPDGSLSFAIDFRGLPWEDESDFLFVDKLRREQILKNHDAKSYDDMVLKNKQELKNKVREIEHDFQNVKSIIHTAKLSLNSYKGRDGILSSYISIPIKDIGVVRSR